MINWGRVLKSVNDATGDLASRSVKGNARHYRNVAKNGRVTKEIMSTAAYKRASRFARKHPIMTGAAGIYGAGIYNALPGPDRANGRSSAMYGVPRRSTGGFA